MSAVTFRDTRNGNDPRISALLKQLDSIDEADRLRDNFALFVRRAWSITDGAELILDRFVMLLCSELQKWALGEYRNLALCVPPGSAKSLLASVLLPAWIWARDPKWQVLCGAHAEELAIRDSMRSRDVIQSDWYSEAFVRGAWKMKDDQNQKRRYYNTAHGLRQGLGSNSGTTGWRGDDIIIDDPIAINPKRPPRREDYENAYRFVQYMRRTRVNDRKRAKSLLIMQRSDREDPVGRLLDKEPDKWRVVCFDASYDSTMPFRHESDWRHTDGELLQPDRYSLSDLRENAEDLGMDSYRAQYGQQPQDSVGGLVRSPWLSYWGAGLPQEANGTQVESRYEAIVASWDCAFKGSDSSSWVVGSVWGVNGVSDRKAFRADLLDLVRIHASFVETRNAIRTLALKWPTCNYVIIEDKANGPAVYDDLRQSHPNLVTFDPAPYGNKEQRLRSISPLFENGSIRLPAGAPWLNEYVKELTTFPQCKHNDQVDSTTQAVLGCLYEFNTWTNPRGGFQLAGL